MIIWPRVLSLSHTLKTPDLDNLVINTPDNVGNTPQCVQPYPPRPTHAHTHALPHSIYVWGWWKSSLGCSANEQASWGWSSPPEWDCLESTVALKHFYRQRSLSSQHCVHAPQRDIFKHLQHKETTPTGKRKTDLFFVGFFFKLCICRFQQSLLSCLFLFFFFFF